MFVDEASGLYAGRGGSTHRLHHKYIKVGIFLMGAN